MTATATADTTQALSGHRYPALAAVKAEGYWWHLAALRESTTLARAVHHVQALAEAADQIAAGLAGTSEAAADTALDPVAWTDIATYLIRLAVALRGGTAGPEDTWEFSEADHGHWEDLAAAASRVEFAAAWYPIREHLRALADYQDGDGLTLRAFTVTQVTSAAAAVIDAHW
jgi:hypothetical protein